MIKIVNEALSTNLPKWLVGSRRFRGIKDALNKRGIDLHNATYVPDAMISSGRDKRLKDPNRLQVFRQGNYVFIPGIYSGDFFHVNGDFDTPTKFSWRDLAAACDEYGYIDLSNPENTNRDIRNQRAAARDGSIERGKGQYKHNKVRYNKKDDGRTDWSNPIDDGYEWATTRGQDKSGYPLPDPDKYVKMLNSVNMDNYGERLDKLYDKILKLRDDVHNADIDTVDYNVYRYFTDVLSTYRDLLKECKSVIDGYNSAESEEEKSYYSNFFSGRTSRGTVRSYSFPWYVTNVEDAIKRVRNRMKKK